MTIAFRKAQASKSPNAAYRGYSDGSIDFFGDPIQAITGYSREEFGTRALKWPDLIVDEDRAGAKAVFVQALKTDKTYQREYRIKAKDGTIIWVRELSQIVCAANGEVKFITGHLVDNTGEKLEELAQLKSEQRSGKYLTFSMSDQEYAVGALNVKAITGMMPVTPVPHTPEFVMGVINSRGRVIPVIDLLNRLGLGSLEQTEKTCIVVTETGGITAGLVVDSVSEVVSIDGAEIVDPPDLGGRADLDYILGMAKTKGGVKILLDVERVMGTVGMAA